MVTKTSIIMQPGYINTELVIAGLNNHLSVSQKHANTCGLLRVDIGTSVSTSTFQALCRLGGRRARASGVRLATESHLCAYTVTCLRCSIIRFPALQLFPHQALHLFPVGLTVPTQARILARDLKKQWKPGHGVLFCMLRILHRDGVRNFRQNGL